MKILLSSGQFENTLTPTNVTKLTQYLCTMYPFQSGVYKVCTLIGCIEKIN